MAAVTLTAQDIFDDARFMHAKSLECLEAGDIRDAAEKAWRSTRRSAEALILARTGEHFENTPSITRELRALARHDAAVQRLRERYSTAIHLLHGDCFYAGLCDPAEHTGQLIRETADFIAAAETLAGG